MSDKSHSHENPLTQLWVAMSGASSGHHEETPGVDDKSVSVGHEPDRFAIGGIVAVPVAVIITLVITYAIVTLLFRYVNGNAGDPLASKDAPLAARQSKIDLTGEPRLDGTPKLETVVNGKEVAPFLMSFRKSPMGQYPDIYPESLRPEVYVEYGSETKPLADPPEAYSENKAFARLPLFPPKDKASGGAHTAVELLLTDEKLRNRYVPVVEHPVSADTKPVDRVKPSNGGAKAKESEPISKPKAH